MVGAALLTAYRNAGGTLDLEAALREIYSRGKEVPGGSLRFLGCLRGGHQRGAVRGHRHKLHAPGPGALGTEQSNDCPGVGEHRQGRRPPVLQTGFLFGNPCRRGVCPGASGGGDGADGPVCSYSAQNNQCIGKRCPFSAAGHKKPTVAFLCVHNSCLKPDCGGPGQTAGRRCVRQRFRRYRTGPPDQSRCGAIDEAGLRH